jgi:hypothetical protein
MPAPMPTGNIRRVGARIRTRSLALLLSMALGAALSMLVAACAGPGSSAVGGAATPTLSPTTVASPVSTATPAATATVTPRPAGIFAFTCSTVVAGQTKTFTDPQLGLSFSYPAAWTENECAQFSASTIRVGNLFFVTAIPREGRTIAQWVDATKAADEVVTLTPLADPYAVEAATVDVTFPSGPDATPPSLQPFIQTFAIVAGARNFYVVGEVIAQISMTDTLNPPGGIGPVVATFREL